MAAQEAPPRVLAIGGSDPTGAAGIQADLKTITALGGIGLTAIAALTVQTAGSVSEVMPIPASVVGAQVDACLEDQGVDVIKTGMLHNVDVVEVIVERVRRLGSAVRLVIDPVLASSSGRRLIDAEGERALVERLLPRAALVTPNIPEAELLTGVSIGNADDMSRAADHFLAWGAQAVLIKGGHLRERQPDALGLVDVLRSADGDEWRFEHSVIAGRFRGTGCTLGSAIATKIAEGLTLQASVERAQDYLRQAMLDSPLKVGPRMLAHGWLCCGA